VEQPELIVTDAVDAGMEAVLAAGLNSFNDEVVGYADRRRLAVVVRDPATGQMLGGAIGRSSLGLLFLDMFYLPPALRKSGLGSKVLRMFEDEGRRRGCASAVLYTISFQAPGFYERCGWQRFGEIACDPPGTKRVFMTKRL
jgi:GNAT superfamily N-acetyltransferase